MKEDSSSYAFDGPTTITAGWVEVDFANTGMTSHQAGIGFVPPAKAADIDAAIAKDGANVAFTDNVGGPNAIAAGKTAKAIVHLDAGEYYVYCYVPDEKDGKHHASHGMVKRLDVTSPSAASSTPSSSSSSDPVQVAGEIEMKDYTYLMPDGFNGKGWYKVSNTGPQAHELTVIKLRDGVTSNDAKDFFVKVAGGPLSAPTVSTLPTPPLPYEDAGGFSAMPSKGTGYVYFDLAPGNYVAMCYVPDVDAPGRTGTPDAHAHFLHGMWSPFTVK